MDEKQFPSSHDEGVDVIDLANAERHWRSATGVSRCAPTWSCDCRFLALSTGDMKEVSVHDLTLPQEAPPILKHHLAAWPQRLAFHPGGQLLAIAGENETLTVLDLSSGVPLAVQEAPAARKLHFSKDGQSLTLTSITQEIHSWSIHEPIGYREWSGRAIAHTETTVFGATLSPDEAFVLTVTSEGVERWNTITGRQTSFHETGNQRIDAQTDAWWLPSEPRAILVQVPGAIERLSVDHDGKITGVDPLDRVPGTSIISIDPQGVWTVRVLDEDGSATLERWPSGDPEATQPLEADAQFELDLRSAADSRRNQRARVTQEETVQLTGKRNLILTPPLQTRFQQILLTADGNRLIGISQDYRLFDWDLTRIDQQLASLGL